MRVNVELQEAEITRGLQRMYKQLGLGRSRLLLCIIASALTAMIFISVINLLQKQDFYRTLTMATVQSFDIVSFVLVFYFIMFFLLRYAPKTQMFRADGMLRSPREIRIEPDGVYQTCRYSNSLTRWSGIRKIEESNEFVFLYVDVVSAYMIPKRCFSAPAEASAFTAQATAYWNAAKTGAAEAPAESP
jgi:hypothetical protein